MKADELISIEAFEQDNGLYYIQFPVYGTFEVDGKKVNINGSSNNFIIELDNKPEVFKINNYTIIDKYISSDDEISKETYDAKIAELQLNGYDWDIDSWTNIDFEYEYKKLIQKYKPVYISTEVKQLVKFDIKHAVANLPKFIEPMKKLNGDLKNTIYVYNQNQHIVQIVREFLLKIGYNEAKSECTTENEFWISNNSIRFSKFGNRRDFMSTKIGLTKYEEKTIYKDTYNKVFELYNRNIKEILEILEIWNLKTKKVEISSYTDIINKLENFKNTISSLEVKVKSSSNKQSLIRNIGNYIEDIKKELLLGNG